MWRAKIIVIKKKCLCKTRGNDKHVKTDVLKTSYEVTFKWVTIPLDHITLSKKSQKKIRINTEVTYSRNCLEKM